MGAPEKVKPPGSNELPCIPVMGGIYFPNIQIMINFVDEKIILDFMKKSRKAIVPHIINIESGKEDKISSLMQTGVLIVLDSTKDKDEETIEAKVSFKVRVKIKNLRTIGSTFFAEYEELPDQIPTEEEFSSAVFQSRYFRILDNAMHLFPTKTILLRADKIGPGSVGGFLDFLAFQCNHLDAPGPIHSLQNLASEPNVLKRLSMLDNLIDGLVTGKMMGEAEAMENMGNDPEIEEQKEEIIKNLKERSKNLKKILSNGSSGNDDYKKRYEEIKDRLPEEVRIILTKEIDRLSSSQFATSDSAVAEKYIESLLDFPWGQYTEEIIDPMRIRKILDEDHFGLPKPKEYLVKHMASLAFNEKKKAPLLCFIGSPGTGKTSLGKSIARATGRKYTRLSLGGVRDEAEIRGHRRTYIGAIPGKIADAITRCGSLNPVFMIDEIDKISKDGRGDPASALLEVLDPEQNSSFRDGYLDVGIDLSRVMFILTGNIESAVPTALRDRVKIIHFSGYTEDEKAHITEEFIIPKELEESGLIPGSQKLKSLGMENLQINITPEAISGLINEYTSESGVRELERKIREIFAEISLRILDKESESKLNGTSFVPPGEINNLGIWKIRADDLGKYLKNERPDKKEKLRMNLPPGVVPILTVSRNGGEVLYVEASYRLAKKRDIKVTGIKASTPLYENVGNMIEESVDIAWDYLFKNNGILSDTKELDEVNLHVNYINGGVPKDGTSAGLSNVAVLFSAFEKQPIKPGLVFTGEITLNLEEIGPVGGIKEKVLAAVRAEAKEIILPFRSMDDAEEIPKEISEKIKIHFLKNIPEALKIMFPNCERLAKL